MIQLIAGLAKKYPLIKKMQNREEVFWLNPHCDNILSSQITESNIKDASTRLERFAPYIQKAFPETAGQNGIIESPLMEITSMKKHLAENHLFDAEKKELQSRLMMKCDNLLPISGSIKARGGIYEVLWLAEKIAIESGILNLNDDYSVLDSEKFRALYSKYSIAVGSTGNLGLSIGIMGAQFGFRVTVHMSSDARQWKKDLLRKKGVNVIEYRGDYQKAVEKGRKQAEQDLLCHFIDDENSRNLFLGYATAASRLEKQLKEQMITVDNAHPLFVYLPCGVGGAPGGVAFGLKQIFGKNVHCFFAEPMEAPCMLLGVMTGLHDGISVQDIGLSGKTMADGLAVGRPSRLVGKIAGNLLDGIFTVSDKNLKQFVIDLHKQENIFAEPSAVAGFPGYGLVQQCKEYIDNYKMENTTHIVWATGGSMVPEAERNAYL